MGQVPAWIVRWGITLLFLVVVALLAGSCFFKYPDVITADMTLTGQHPATAVVTRAAGKIQELLVTDNRPVRQGDWLAVIENHANTNDAIYLDKVLDRSGMDVDSLNKALSKYKELSLGDMQAAYSGLLSALHACINYREIDYYPQKMTSIRKQIALYKAYYNETERQRKTLSEQFALTRRQYARDSLLYSRSVISSYEHETARASLLQSRYSLEGAAASAENLRIQIGEQEQSLLDLTLERSEKEFTLRQVALLPHRPGRGCRDFHQVLEREPVYPIRRGGFHRRAARREPAGGEGAHTDSTLGKSPERPAGDRPFLQFPGSGVWRGKRRGIEYLIGPHRRVLYGGYRFSKGSENQLRYRPARLARDASLRGDRNGRITPDRTILPPDQTDRERRILV